MSIKRRDGKCVDGVALFKNGGLLVASGGEVFAYNATGSKCTKIGKRGQGGLIDNGLDVCVLPNDNIAVCDWGSAAIKVFSPVGYFLSSLPAQPRGMAILCSVDPACPWEGKIVVCCPLWEMNRSVGLYSITEDGSRQEIDTIVEKGPSSFDINWPRYVAAHGLDRIVVSDGDASVFSFSCEGSTYKLQWRFGNGRGSGQDQLSFPFGVTFDSSGNSIIADSGNHRVVKISPEGKFLDVILKMEYPWSVSILDERLIVGQDNGTVSIFKYMNVESI